MAGALKAARAGKLMMWFLGFTAAGVDSDSFLALAASSSIGTNNFARFRNEQYDKLYDRQRQLPDGKERERGDRADEAHLGCLHAYKVHGHQFVNDLSQPWLIGYAASLRTRLLQVSGYRRHVGG